MSSRPILSPFQVITNGDMSQTSITSSVTVIQNLSQVGYDISWSGTSPVGTITVQVSNTYTQNAAGGAGNAGNWTDLTLTSTFNVSGNTGNGYIDLDAISAYAIRLKYTKGSGTGTLNATICGKVS